MASSHKRSRDIIREDKPNPNSKRSHQSPFPYRKTIFHSSHGVPNQMTSLPLSQNLNPNPNPNPNPKPNPNPYDNHNFKPNAYSISSLHPNPNPNPNPNDNSNPSLTAIPYPRVPHSPLNPTPETDKGHESPAGFADLPADVIHSILFPLSLKDMCSASQTCKGWREASRSLREAMLFFHWGKLYKHGMKGVRKNREKSLDCFLKAATRGSLSAMVDAGLMLWEKDCKKDSIQWYRKAAEGGNSQGQCNLGLALLKESEASGSSEKEAVEWLEKSAWKGNGCAQYTLGLCFQQGRGNSKNMTVAAEWYTRAAQMGNSRAMYNLARCYELGEGVSKNEFESSRWMKKAAHAGHSGAQHEHAKRLLKDGDGVQAHLFLVRAAKGGNTAAIALRNRLRRRLDHRVYPQAVRVPDF